MKSDSAEVQEFSPKTVLFYNPPSVPTAQPPSATPQFSPQEQWIPQQNNDILADILPPSGSSPPSGQSVQPYPNIVGGFLAQSGSADHAASQFSSQYNITLETSSHSWVLHRLLLMVLYLPNLLSNASTFTVSFSGPNVFSLIFKPPPPPPPCTFGLLFNH